MLLLVHKCKLNKGEQKMMLDEFLGTWLDKQKAKRELCKVYKMYDKKKELYLQSSVEIYCEFQDIQYAIAYV